MTTRDTEAFTQHINDYAKTTKTTCMCIVSAIILIVLFVLSPLKNRKIVSLFGLILIIGIMGYAFYINTFYTWKLSRHVDLFIGGWNIMKINILASYVFSFFMLYLIFCVIQKRFRRVDV